MTDETPSDGLATGAPAPRYAGEDTRATSPRELAGWYMYAFAAETYVLCGELLPVSRPRGEESRRVLGY
ncbi:hypothetical protein IMZ48_13895 [Candidatus Bathyarchaeota archaeon]|nr:hypothetical protein [Candidatus Bathyarchaeota archaeon]